MSEYKTNSYVRAQERWKTFHEIYVTDTKIR